MKMMIRRARWTVGISFGVVLVAVCALWLPAAPEPSAAPAAAAPALQQGLSLTIEPLAAKKSTAVGTPDVQSVRLVGLYVPQGKAPSSITPAGRFRATWDGNINVKLRERFSFLAAGRGTLKMSIDDKVVLDVSGDDFTKKPSEEVRLKKGANHVVIVYESPESGDAAVRLMWMQKGVPPEPIPPTALTHDSSTGPTQKGNLVREGRFLLAELRCTKCHSAGDIVAPNSKDSMPELAADAPSLKDIGTRLNRSWMAAWISNPKSMRADAHMPRVFCDSDGSKPDPRALDTAAYLATLGNPVPVDAVHDAQSIKTGGELFASLFCVACHTAPGTPSDAAMKDASGRVPLSHISSKFTPAGLEEYLAHPQAHYAWNPMPNFKLSVAEAKALAAYLRSQKHETIDLPAGDAAKGKDLVFSSGCLNCHELESGNTFKAPDLSKIAADAWSRGCLAPKAPEHKSAPDYTLTDAERTALSAFAATDHTSLARDAAAEFSLRQFNAMRCSACHPRDGQQPAITTTASADVGALYEAFFPNDAAAKPAGAEAAPAANPLPALSQQPAGTAGERHPLAPDQRSLPLLTWVGEKLRPEWSDGFIKGSVPYKPRYYLRSRMPAFAARADLLAQGFASEHGFAPTSAPLTAPNAEMAQAGQKLIGANGGFSCVQCHAVGPQGALAPFEAPAINFEHVAERLRREYYDRWMRNPIRVDPATKMPQFGDADMQTAIKTIYEGDANKQFSAIWEFLLEGKEVRPPQ